MARVTVEDCAQVVENRFELVALASKRAKDIYSGTPITIVKDNDKNPVIALREIAAQTIDVPTLRENLIHENQKNVRSDALYGDNIDDFGEDVNLGDQEILEIDEMSDFITDENLFDGDDSISFIDDNIDFED